MIVYEKGLDKPNNLDFPNVIDGIINSLLQPFFN